MFVVRVVSGIALGSVSGGGSAPLTCPWWFKCSIPNGKTIPCILILGHIVHLFDQLPSQTARQLQHMWAFLLQCFKLLTQLVPRWHSSRANTVTVSVHRDCVRSGALFSHTLTAIGQAIEVCRGALIRPTCSCPPNFEYWDVDLSCQADVPLGADAYSPGAGPV